MNKNMSLRVMVSHPEYVPTNSGFDALVPKLVGSVLRDFRSVRRRD